VELARDLSAFDDLAIDGPAEFLSPPGLIHGKFLDAWKAFDRASTDELARHGLLLQKFEEHGLPSEASPSSARHHKEPQANILDVIWESSKYEAWRDF
jgi:hypothetical protein